jgi:nuclear pore complex protein Nup98-Nup96
MSFGGGFGGFGSNNNTQSTGFGGFGAANTNNASAGKSMLFFHSCDGSGAHSPATHLPATSAGGHSTNPV